MTDTSLLLFLHIPKTAGMSMLNVITRRYSEMERFPIYELPEKRIQQLRAMIDSEIRSLRVIYGHFTYGIHRYLGANCVYFTILRNPVDMLVSDYYHIKRHPSSSIYEVVQKGEVMDFLSYRFFEQGLTNRMTRLISGYYGVDEGFPDADLAKYKPLPGDALEMAQNNIEAMFSLVGTVEYFDETLLFLKDIQKWQNAFYIKRNVNEKRPAASRRQVDYTISEFIYEHNQMDVALYEKYQKILATRITERDIHFQNRVNKFRVWNDRYASIMRLRYFHRIFRRLPHFLRQFL